MDALAARSTERLLTTVQISDAGIQPGSGVGNKRFGITRQTLGVPVLAMGVPTVVHATTVVGDGLERLAADGAGPRAAARAQRRMAALGPPPGAGGPPPVLPPAVKREVVEQVLEPFMGDLIMTPKEIDVLVEDVAETLAEG